MATKARILTCTTPKRNPTRAKTKAAKRNPASTKKASKTKRSSGKDDDKLTPEQRRRAILREITRDGGELSADHIAKKTFIDIGTVRRDLAFLVKYGAIGSRITSTTVAQDWGKPQVSTRKRLYFKAEENPTKTAPKSAKSNPTKPKAKSAKPVNTRALLSSIKAFCKEFPYKPVTHFDVNGKTYVRVGHSSYKSPPIYTADSFIKAVGFMTHPLPGEYINKLSIFTSNIGPKVRNRKVIDAQPPNQNPSGSKAKKNPSDLKSRAKSAAKAAADSAREKAKSAAKRAGTATSRAAKAGAKKGAEVAKRAAKAGAAKGAELSKKAAVYTGEKLKQGGKRVGRKASGVAKEAWSGIVKGWKENPTTASSWDGIKSQIDWLMGRVHVGTPDEEVRANIEKRCKKAGFDAKLTRRCSDYAIKAHRKNQQMYSDVMSGNLGPKRRKTKKNPTLYKKIASNPVPRAGGYIYRIAYETWDEEALEAGDTDDKGWKVEESEPYDSLEELLNSVSHDASWLEWSSSHPSSRDWIISQDDQDRTGDRTQYSLFIERSDGKPLTTAQLKLIDKKLRLRGRFGRTKPRSNPTPEATKHFKARLAAAKSELKACRDGTWPRDTNDAVRYQHLPRMPHDPPGEVRKAHQQYVAKLLEREIDWLESKLARDNPSQDQVHLSQKGKQWHVMLDKHWVPISDAEAKRQIESGEAVKVPWGHKAMSHHDRPGYIDPKRLGLMLQNWHYGQGDPVYAAGSSLFAGKSVPTEILADALGRIRSLKTSSTSKHDKKGHKELVTIEKNLAYLVGTRRAREAGTKSNPAKKHYPFDEKTYSVVAAYGYSKRNLTREEAVRHVKEFRNDIKNSGAPNWSSWSDSVKIYDGYGNLTNDDGSMIKKPVVETKPTVAKKIRGDTQYRGWTVAKDGSYWIAKHPEHMPNGKVVSTLKQAKEYIDEYMGPEENPAKKSAKFLAWTNAPAAYDYWYVKDTGKTVNGFRLVEVTDKERWEQFQVPRYESGMNVAFPASDKARVKQFGLDKVRVKKNPIGWRGNVQYHYDILRSRIEALKTEDEAIALRKELERELDRIDADRTTDYSDAAENADMYEMIREVIDYDLGEAYSAIVDERDFYGTAKKNPVKSGGKVKARSITLTKLSGSKDVGKSVTLEGGNVWAKADRKLSLWAEPPAQEKIRFTVSYADAETYTGTYATGDELGGESLAGHIRMTLDAVAAASPSQISETDRKKWQSFRARYETGCSVCDNPTVTKLQVKKLLAQYKIPGQLSGKGSDWTLELPDEKAYRLWKRTAGKSVRVGGYRSGFGSWVLSPGYQSKGDWNDPSSRHHY